MLRFYARPFLEAHRLVTQITQVTTVDEADKLRFGSDVIAILDTQLASLCEQLKQLELRTTLIAAERFRARLPNIGFLSGARFLVSELQSRWHDEIETVFFLELSPRDQEFFDAITPFGVDVATKFPSVTYEITEAAKCLGLERSTASAFHSIRCLEVGIRAISRCLGIPDPTRAGDRSWAALLAEVKQEIDRRWPGSRSRMHGDGQTFDDTYAALAAMRNPWRNATMHLDQIYTEQDARDLFNIVGAFMRRLAERFDENGDPKA